MSRCAKLLAKAKRSPAGLRFEELVQLAECHGFRLVRRRGSHCVFRRQGFVRPLVLQRDAGMAKRYQVRQLLNAIEEADPDER